MLTQGFGISVYFYIWIAMTQLNNGNDQKFKNNTNKIAKKTNFTNKQDSLKWPQLFYCIFFYKIFKNFVLNKFSIYNNTLHYNLKSLRFIINNLFLCLLFSKILHFLQFWQFFFKQFKPLLICFLILIYFFVYLISIILFPTNVQRPLN